MIDHATIDRIMDAAQIVDVVSDFVTLKKRGVNYVGLCPFHSEKTPSFSVSPAKNLCKCFSCGKGGNPVHFIMEHEQMSYVEALRFLAKKYHIEFQEREQTDEERQAQSLRESLFVVNEFACDYFKNILNKHGEGRGIGMGYFRQRGFRDDIIEKFQLGFCLSARDAFANEALSKGYKREYLIKTGLCYEDDRQQLRDRFHGRVIFPVHSIAGKIVAFGGRILSADKKVAKYVNSPESEIYSKSNELYGLYLAKAAIVKQDNCFLVEGYTDVISMHQAGIENVVASSGTSLTKGQIKLIHRFTSNLTLLYDGDMAGIKASLRGINLLLEEGMHIKVVLLPDGEDPDSFSRQHDAAEFRAFIQAHEVDFIRFKIDLLKDETKRDPVKRAALINEVIESISLIPEVVMRDIYIRESAQQLQMDEALLVREMAKLRKARFDKEQVSQQADSRQTNAADGQPAAVETTVDADNEVQRMTMGQRELMVQERMLMQMVVRYGERVIFTELDENEQEREVRLAEYVESELQNDDLQLHDPLHRSMLTEVVEHLNDQGFTAQRYFVSHPDTAISRLGYELSSDRYQLSKYHEKVAGLTNADDAERSKLEQIYNAVSMLIINFKCATLRDEMQQLLRRLQDPTVGNDPEKYRAIMEAFKEKHEVLKLIEKQEGDRVILPPTYFGSGS